MSGGHFDYQQYHMQEIADSIDDYVNGHEIDDDDVVEILNNRWFDETEKQYAKEHKRSAPNRCGYSDKTIAEFKKGIDIIRMAYIYAQRIDWLLSCDDGEESFHDRLKEELADIKYSKYIPLIDDLLNGKAMIVDTNWLEEHDTSIAKDAYIQGAIDQKKLDDEEYRKDMRYINTKKQELIDKSCEWWRNYLDYPTHTQEDRDRISEMVNDFRKAMES